VAGLHGGDVLGGVKPQKTLRERLEHFVGHLGNEIDNERQMLEKGRAELNREEITDDTWCGLKEAEIAQLIWCRNELKKILESD
jgi:hypothetical protein